MRHLWGKQAPSKAHIKRSLNLNIPNQQYFTILFSKSVCMFFYLFECFFTYLFVCIYLSLWGYLSIITGFSLNVEHQSFYYSSKVFKKALLHLIYDLCYTVQNLKQNSEVKAHWISEQRTYFTPKKSSFWSRNKLVTGSGIFLSAHRKNVSDIISETACVEILMFAKCICECLLSFK